MTKDERNERIIALRHLPIWRIQLEVEATRSCINKVLKRAGYSVVHDNRRRSEKLSAAYARQADDRTRAALETLEKARNTTREEGRVTPPTSVPKSALMLARRILGDTGDIRKAAELVGMSPTRLQRQINHLR